MDPHADDRVAREETLVLGEQGVVPAAFEFRKVNDVEIGVLLEPLVDPQRANHVGLGVHSRGRCRLEFHQFDAAFPVAGHPVFDPRGCGGLGTRVETSDGEARGAQRLRQGRIGGANASIVRRPDEFMADDADAALGTANRRQCSLGEGGIVHGRAAE